MATQRKIEIGPVKVIVSSTLLLRNKFSVQSNQTFAAIGNLYVHYFDHQYYVENEISHFIREFEVRLPKENLDKISLFQ